MISSISLGILGYSITHANVLSIIPFKWNWKNSRVVNCNSTWNLFKWRLNIGLMTLYEIFLITRFIQRYYFSKTLHISLITTNLTYMSAFMFANVFQLEFRNKMKDLIIFINHYLEYFSKFEGDGKKSIQMISKYNYIINIKFWEILLILLGAHSIFQPLVFICLHIGFPSSNIFLSSILPQTMNLRDSHDEIYSWIYIIALLLFGMIDIWFIAGLFSFLFFALSTFAIYFFTVLELLKKEITKTKHKVPSLGHGLFGSLHVLNNSINYLLQNYVYFVENNSLIVLTVQAFTLIRLLSKITLLHFATFIIGFTIAFIYLILSNELLGSHHQSSLDLIRLLKGSTLLNSTATTTSRRIGEELDESQKMGLKYKLKYYKALQPIKIRLGSFNFYNREKKITIIWKIVFYTSRLLILIK